MTTKMVTRLGLAGILVGTFTLGYVCGSENTPPASAQIQIPGGLPGGAGGGALGSVMQLGSSITEMEQHVSGLQKNLNTLKSIQSSLGGK